MKKFLVTIPLGIWVGWAWAANGPGQGIPPAGNSGASATDGFATNQPSTAGANEINRARDPRYLIPGQTVPPLDSGAAYRANTNPGAGSTGTTLNIATTTNTSVNTAGAFTTLTTATGVSTGSGTATNSDGTLPPGFRR